MVVVVAAVSLQDAADLATLGIGVLALGTSAWFGYKAHQMQRMSEEQGLANELGDVISAIAQIIPRIFTADPKANYEAFERDGPSLRLAAFRADQLVKRLPELRVSAHDLGLIGQALFTCWENDLAFEYFDAAGRRSRHSDTPNAVAVSVCRLAGDSYFKVRNIPQARRMFEQALEVVHDDNPDVTRMHYIFTLLTWAANEFSNGYTDERDQLVARAKECFREYETTWRRESQRVVLPRMLAAAGVQSTGTDWPPAPPPQGPGLPAVNGVPDRPESMQPGGFPPMPTPGDRPHDVAPPPRPGP